MAEDQDSFPSLRLQEQILNSELDLFLRSTLKGKRVGVIRPGGNHGDELIYRGLEKRLDELGIDYQVFSYFDPNDRSIIERIKKTTNLSLVKFGIVPFRFPDFTDVDHIYIHGGGNINDIWPYVLRMVSSLFHMYPDKDITIGPQSYYFKEIDFKTIISEHKSNLNLFCREKYSKDVLINQGIQKYATINMSPDTAFYLSRADLIGYAQRALVVREGVSCGEYTLFAFRNDVESTISDSLIKKLENENINNIVKNDISIAPSFREFVSLAEYADYIYTDRLHGGILGSILGKEVTLIENSYYKTQGVYEYSLKKYDSIEFISTDELSNR